MKKVVLVIPVYNEENIIQNSLKAINNWCLINHDFQWKIVVADNGSTDRTSELANSLVTKLDTELEVIKIFFKGRGFALKVSWFNCNADVYVYMDADLSTDLNDLLALIKPISLGIYDLVIGSRRHTNSEVSRSVYREVISRGYIILCNLILNSKVSDLQCGFKAVNRRVVKNILPEIIDNQWFFDTELIWLSEKKSYKILEIPIKWNEDANSSVDIIKTIMNYIKNLIRLKNSSHI